MSFLTPMMRPSARHRGYPLESRPMRCFCSHRSRGGATKVRHSIGLSVRERGNVRRTEMAGVARVLDLSDLIVLDLSDGKQTTVDPQWIEGRSRSRSAASGRTLRGTYPAHGINGLSGRLVSSAAGTGTVAPFLR